MFAKDSKDYLAPSTPSSSSTVDSFLAPELPSLNEFSIITLLPCEYDPIDGYGSASEDSMDSSDILDSSDDELETVKINVFYKPKEESIKTN